MREITYCEAINEALKQVMEKNGCVFIMGEGVDDPKGIFGSTLGLQQKFGKDRVFDMPLSENGMTGVAVGAALVGMRPIMTHQRIDFTLYAMDQIVNHAAKWNYMSGGTPTGVPITIRAVIGRGWGQGVQHSQNLQALFMHIPGLKVVMPTTPHDVKGLLIASIEDNNPVIFIEHRWLYNRVGPVPEEMYTVPIGKGTIAREGKDVTVAATSFMTVEAGLAADTLAKEGIEAEIVDIRTIKPLDETLIFESVQKTGRLVVADSGWITGGVGAEVVARVADKAFKYLLKAPIKRISLPDVPTPTSCALTEVFYPGPQHIVAAVKEVLLDEKTEVREKPHKPQLPSDVPDKEFKGPF
jgi:pyruvate dehydrogenase E1 component beta subunit